MNGAVSESAVSNAETSTETQGRRNPGPSWGFRFLLEADRRMPAFLLRPLLAMGTWVAVALMSERRRASRALLGELLGRRAGVVDVWRHFHAFVAFLMLRLRAARGDVPRCTIRDAQERTGREFRALLDSAEPALYGTFHFGYSDLLGFLLTQKAGRVAMVRQRVGNSAELEWLERQFRGHVSFIWSNETAELPFRLKAAIDAGASVALQCDRIEGASRTAAFRFRGASRLFPFAIYHLAILFHRPVVFCLAVPENPREVVLDPSPIYRPDASLGRDENLRHARAHFQAVLSQLETLALRHPYLWFNFEPLNPVAPEASEERRP